MSLVNETWSRDVPPQNFPLAAKMRVVVKGWGGWGGGSGGCIKKPSKNAMKLTKFEL